MGAVESQCCSVISASAGAALPKGQERREVSPKVTAEDIQRIAKAVETRLPKPSRKSHAAELESLRSFIKDRYSSAGDAFDQLFNRQPIDEDVSKLLNDGGFKAMFKTQRVDQATFKKCFVAAGYPGNALLLFDLLKDADNFVTRACFKFRLEESQGNMGKGQNSCRNLNAKGDDEPPTKVDQESDGGSGVSCQDECQSLGSASTTDTALPKVQMVDAKVPGLSSPRKMPIATVTSALRLMSTESGITTDIPPPQKIRRLDLLRPPPLKILSPGSSTKGKNVQDLNKAQSSFSIPKTPARPKRVQMP